MHNHCSILCASYKVAGSSGSQLDRQDTLLSSPALLSPLAGPKNIYAAGGCKYHLHCLAHRDWSFLAGGSGRVGNFLGVIKGIIRIVFGWLINSVVGFF